MGNDLYCQTLTQPRPMAPKYGLRLREKIFLVIRKLLQYK